MLPDITSKINYKGLYAVAQKMYSANPTDKYLSVVLVYRPADDIYIIWTYNAEQAGFSNGSYIHSDILEAMQVFNERGQL